MKLKREQFRLSEYVVEHGRKITPVNGVDGIHRCAVLLARRRQCASDNNMNGAFFGSERDGDKARLIAAAAAAD